MRAASGMGMMDCKQAAEEAHARYGGDYVLALLVRSANAYAVNIKPGPGQTAKQARDRWNLADALGRREDIVTRTDEWAALDAVSTRYEP